MKVEKWLSFEDIPEESARKKSGGWFSSGDRWEDYIKRCTPEEKGYADALRTEILYLGIKETGAWHQNSKKGVPVFDDGTYTLFSYRAWGDLLAAIWSEEEDKDFCYMDFYC